nr:hypothetical protein [Tanacetum cinerariifolium]
FYKTLVTDYTVIVVALSNIVFYMRPPTYRYPCQCVGSCNQGGGGRLLRRFANRTLMILPLLKSLILIKHVKQWCLTRRRQS